MAKAKPKSASAPVVHDPPSPSAATIEDPNTSAESRPAHTIRYGAARGLIWRAEFNGKTTFAVTVERCAQAKEVNSIADVPPHRADDTEQSSDIFLADDLGYLIKTVTECRKWIQWQDQQAAQAALQPVTKQS